MRSALTRLILLVSVAAPGCRASRPPRSGSRAPCDAAAAAHATQPAHAAQAVPAAAEKAQTVNGPIHWIYDDYSGALARARAQRKPLVIDEWARWCDICMSMKRIILTNQAFRPLADRFVWLALDVDKPKNIAALKRFPAPLYPTFYVVDPENQKVEAQHLRSTTVAGFRAFLRRGARGMLDDLGRSGKLARGSPLALVRTGDRAAAREDYTAAARAYSAALASAPARWPRRMEVLVSRIAALAYARSWKKCAALARSITNVSDETSGVTDFAAYGNLCAGHLKNHKAARHLRRLLSARLSALLATSSVLSVDDRSQILELQWKMYDALHRVRMARRVARKHQELVDRAAATATTPLLKMVYNRPRTNAYIHLGEEKKLIPAIEKSMAALPREPDPPYRLAQIFHKLGQQGKAAKMAERAASLAYGPRKATIQELAVEIAKAEGDVAAEKKVLIDLIATYRSLPRWARNPADENKAGAELASLRASGTGRSRGRGKAHKGKRTPRHRN